jgi:hypothetical protein
MVGRFIVEDLSSDRVTGRCEIHPRGPCRSPKTRPRHDHLKMDTLMSEVDRLIARIREVWPDLTILLPKSDDRYRSLPLCIIDAVYSIGVRYESTERTLDDFCTWSHWNYEQEYTVNEFIALLDPFDGDWERLATKVFQNRQRTSSRSGILKAEAVCRFARGLRSSDVDSHADIPKEVKFDPPDHLVSTVTAIPGPSSGISLKYFLMLAGYDGTIKPDRMVVRFVADALGRINVTPILQRHWFCLRIKC